MPDSASRPVFRRLKQPERRVSVVIDGETVQLPEGEPLAAALLAEGRLATSHSLRRDEPRGPLCLMGTCGQCSAEIDGARHQRTCRTSVREGMRVDLRIAKQPGDEE